MDKTAVLDGIDYRRFYLEKIPSLKINGKTEAIGCCPFHDDQHPSFGVNVESGLWRCYAGCGAGDLFSFEQKLEGIRFPEAVDRVASWRGMKANALQSPRQVLRRFLWVDAEGTTAHHLRWNQGRPKFTWARDADGTQPGLGVCQPTLYHLDEVRAASVVVLVEGEHDAETINAWFTEVGLKGKMIATTTAYGAGDLKPSYLAPLHGKTTVCLSGDNDVAGQGYIQEAGGLLETHVTDLRVLRVPDGFKDWAEWAESGTVGARDFCALLKAAPTWRDQSDSAKLGASPVTQLAVVEPISLDSSSLRPLPVEALPGWFRDMALAVSEATETPVELAVMFGVAVLGTSCQKTFIVSPIPGYVEPLNIWTVAALDSGNRKTAVMTAMTAPLLEWQRQQQEAARQCIVAAHADQETIKARIKELRAKASHIEDIEDFEKAKKEIQVLEQSLQELPVSPRLWSEDVTPERLGQLMAEQGERLSLLSDEGGIFELMGGRYSAGIPNIDIFLKAHAGSPVCVDRGSRPPVMMQHPALTIGLSPQPEVLRGLAEKPGFRGRGLLARFLYALPNSRLGHRGLDPRPVPDTVAIRYRAAIYALLELKPQIVADDYKPHTLHLTDDAQRAWKAFQKAVEPELLEGGQFENLKDWAGKLPGAAIRLAGLLHCAEHAHRSPAGAHISLSTMTQALDLANVLAEHALAAFDLIGSDPVMDAARKLWRWIERTQTKEPSARDCFQALKGTYRRMADLEPAFDVLVERFYLFEAPQSEGKPSRGRPSRRFSVNPILATRWA